MANIQTSINQMISLAGLLASQNPALQAASAKKTEIKQLKKKEEAVRSQIENIENIAEKEPYGKELTEIKKQQFEVDPSSETYKAWKETETKKVAEATADPEEKAKELLEQEEFEQEVEYYKNLYRGTAPESKASDPYAELFRKYGADAYEVADTHSQDAQRRLAETRRRNKEVIYGSENDR